MYEKFKRQLTALCGELPRSLLVALSGGSDSVALLSLCVRLRAEEGTSVHALHFDHHIRGEEAERDAQFCQELCLGQNVVFHLAEADVPRLAKEKGQGLEECGRNCRYAALEKVRAEEKIDCILTAHNADDLLETVLFRIARGTGLKGLCGIPQKNGAVLRPMLSFTKAEIENFCRENGSSYVTDSSNSDKSYHRNRIRAEAMPALRAVRTDASEHALTLCTSLCEDEEFIALMLPQGRLGSVALKSLHPALLKRYIVREYEDYLRRIGKNATLEAVHMAALRDLIERERLGASCSLPGTIKATLTANGLVFSEDKVKKQDYFLPILQGENPIPGVEYSIFLDRHEKFIEFSSKKEKIHNLFIQVAGKNGTIKELFYMRSRNPGDRIRFGGMTREISKLVAKQTADPQLRRQYPLVCDEVGILWLPGYPQREDSNNKSAVTKDENIMYLWIGEKHHELPRSEQGH